MPAVGCPTMLVPKSSASKTQVPGWNDSFSQTWTGMRTPGIDSGGSWMA